jgi:phage gpG-like protein
VGYEVVAFRISVYGVNHAEQTFDNIGDNAANIRPALEEIYLTMLDIEQELFEKEGARGGPRWAKLDIDWLKWKIKRGFSPEILRWRDNLYYAMTVYRSRHAFVRITQEAITLRPINEVYHYHMTGTSTMPKRTFVRFTQQDKDAFAREISRHLTRGRTPLTTKVDFVSE